jgi:hypothetical protein
VTPEEVSESPIKARRNKLVIERMMMMAKKKKKKVVDLCVLL